MLLLSCAKPTKSFTPDRFVHDEYAYAVHYLSQGPENLLGADWRLDNYVWNKGVPKKQKQGGEYVVHREYDMNDDGEVDTKADEPYYDLLLEHRRKDATIWVRSAPISNHDRTKELAVFAESYVEAASGSDSVLVQFGAGGPIGSVSKRFASRVLSRAECSVSGVPAYRVDFEVANVDQLQLTPNARWIRSRIVLVQTPFAHVPNRRVPKKTLPIVMVAGLRAAPEDFERLAADFDLMLDRIVIANVKGALTMSTPVPHTCRVAGAEAREPSAPAAESVAPAGQPAEGASSAAPAPSTAPATSAVPAPATGASAVPANSPPVPAKTTSPGASGKN
jgi:hypothetical protein